MKIWGEVESQRAPTSNGSQTEYGPLYCRTLSMAKIKASGLLKERVTLTRNEDVAEGMFKFSGHDDKNCVLPCKGYMPQFKACLLEKVRLEDDFSEVKDEFYPTVKRLMDGPHKWGVEFTFHGRSVFADKLMEWTERILKKHSQKLKAIGIYGLVGASQYPYNLNKDVWKAFCELWSSLTNTLHHGGGEIGISLNDLKHISGLPILGDPYEEYLPPNAELLDRAKFPSTAAELLRIHARLCRHEGVSNVSWYKWIQNFYRGEQIHLSYGDPFPNKKSPPTSDKKKVPHAQTSKETQKKLLSLQVSDEEELAAYLSLLLSRFVFPTKSRFIRPETFVMASFMAQGKKISLAPAALGHIYHGLGEVANHSGNPGSAKPSFGIHFVLGWLAEYFPSLYSRRPTDKIQKDFSPLARIAGIHANAIDLCKARLLFRGTEKVSYRSVSFGVDIGGKDYIDSGKLPSYIFEHLVTIRHAMLPVRLGVNLMLEPYYPNRFARQFGFDQGIPANDLDISFLHRSKKSLEDIARAYARLFRTNTGTLFHIPQDYHQGAYTYPYCGWWARVSTPYLSQSCDKVKTMLLGKKKDPIFTIKDISTSSTRSKRSAKAPKANEHHDQFSSPEYSPHSYANTPTFSKDTANKRKAAPDDFLDEESVSVDINPKRVRHRKESKSDSSESVGFHDKFFQDNPVDVDGTTSVEERTSIIADNPSPSRIIVASKPESSYQNEKEGSMAIVPLQSVPSTLQAIFSQLTDDWVCQSLSNGVNSIIKSISTFESPQQLLAKRLSVMKWLDTLQAIAKVNQIDLGWFILKIQELFDDAEAAKGLADTIDPHRVEELSAQLTQRSSMLASKQAQISLLPQRALHLEERKKKILVLKEELVQMETAFEADKSELEKDRGQLQDSVREDEEIMHRLKGELEQAGQDKVIELNSKKQRIQDLIDEIIISTSFN